MTKRLTGVRDLYLIHLAIHKRAISTLNNPISKKKSNYNPITNPIPYQNQNPYMKELNFSSGNVNSYAMPNFNPAAGVPQARNSGTMAINRSFDIGHGTLL